MRRLNGYPTLLHVLLLAQPLVTMLRTGSTGPHASIYPSRHRREPEGKAAVAVRPCAAARLFAGCKRAAGGRVLGVLVNVFLYFLFLFFGVLAE